MHPSYNSHNTTVLKAQLLQQLPRLVDALFSNRTIHRSTHEYRVGAHGSISMRLSDGCYFNHETGEGGDLLTLIQHVLRTDFKGALVWARGFVGHQHIAVNPVPSPSVFEQRKNARIIQQRGKALAILRRATPIAETLAARYLSDKRGIVLNPLPSSLRFVPHQYHSRDKG
jgi:hypothetical protein